MSIIKDIRKAVDTRLDHLDDRAEALEAQLEEAREDALQRIEEQKKRLVEAMSRVEETVASSAAETSEELRAAFDHLRVQLALGKAETADLLGEQEQKIRRAIRDLETLLEKAEEGLEGNYRKQSTAFVRIANKLRAEFEAAELQFALLRAEHRDEIQADKAALRKKLKELREKLKNAGHEAGDKFERFETEFGEGLKHIGRAFQELGKGH